MDVATLRFHGSTSFRPSRDAGLSGDPITASFTSDVYDAGSTLTGGAAKPSERVFSTDLLLSVDLLVEVAEDSELALNYKKRGTMRNHGDLSCGRLSLSLSLSPRCICPSH